MKHQKNKISLKSTGKVMQKFRDFKCRKYKKYVKCLAGPIGSGKTYATLFEVFVMIYQQPKNIQGIRTSKWAFVKHELARTKEIVADEWMKKFGEWTKYNKSTGIMIFWDSNNKVYSEIELLGLHSRLDAEKYLKSKRYTHAWINEAYLIHDPGVIDVLIGRIGRFPMGQQGCILIDTNLPNIDHWMYERFEEKREQFPNYYIFYQPSGLSDEAENRQYMPKEAYEIMALNYDEGMCKRDVHGQYAFVSSGQPIYPNFSRYKNELIIEESFSNWTRQTFRKFSISQPIIIGVDTKLNPACTYSFRDDITGFWYTFDEICLFNESCEKIAELMLQKQYELQSIYGLYDFKYYVDPAGKQRSEIDKQTVIKLFRGERFGLDAQEAHSQNTFTLRRESAGHLINKKKVRILKNCRMLIEGLEGGYHRRQLNKSGEVQYNNEPEKNKYSHICEAWEYGFLGVKTANENLFGYDSEKSDKEWRNFMAEWGFR